MLLAIDTGQTWSDVQDFVNDHLALSIGIAAALVFLAVALYADRRRRKLARRYVTVGRVPPMTRRQKRVLRRQRRKQSAQERQLRRADRHRAWEAEKNRRKAARAGGTPAVAAQATEIARPPQPAVPVPKAKSKPVEPPPELAAPPASARRDHLIDVATERLREVEARAELAERRAEEAKRLAELQEQEAERDVHLRELQERVRDAAGQAEEAERRARAAEVAAERSAKAVEEASSANDELAASVGAEEGFRVPDSKPAQAASLSIPGWVSQKVTDLNKATFDQLREVGLSVTQATRVLTQRDKDGGFDSVDALDKITGMPGKLLDEIKKRLTV